MGSVSDETDLDSQPATGFKTKTLIIAGLVTAFLWVVAIDSGSVVFISIVGVLTVLALGILYWAWRQVRTTKDLSSMLMGAADSPEKRAAALAKLSSGKKANKQINVIARAQLMAADDPKGALELLETIMIKDVAPAMQDDVALLKSQLYLSFGRAQDARPLCDMINVDSPAREANRPLMVGIVAECWARTGSAKEAVTLLKSVDANSLEPQMRAQVLVAQAFARFASGNKGATRAALKQLAAIDVNALGRFIAPQFKVHAGLQRLAREEAQRHPQVRKQQQMPHRARPR